MKCVTAESIICARAIAFARGVGVTKAKSAAPSLRHTTFAFRRRRKRGFTQHCAVRKFDPLKELDACAVLTQIFDAPVAGPNLVFE